MKIFLEQDDIFQAVREFLAKKGMQVPADGGYDVRQTEDGSVTIEIPGVVPVPMVAAPEPPVVSREKSSRSVVQGAGDVSGIRQALDPGDPPPQDDDNVALVRQGPARSPRRRGEHERTMPMDDMGKDPEDFRDEI